MVIAFVSFINILVRYFNVVYLFFLTLLVIITFLFVFSCRDTRCKWMSIVGTIDLSPGFRKAVGSHSELFSARPLLKGSYMRYINVHNETIFKALLRALHGS